MCIFGGGTPDPPPPPPSPPPPPPPERTADRVSAPSGTVDARLNKARVGLEALRIPLTSAQTLSV